MISSTATVAAAQRCRGRLPPNADRGILALERRSAKLMRRSMDCLDILIFALQFGDLAAALLERDEIVIRTRLELAWSLLPFAVCTGCVPWSLVYYTLKNTFHFIIQMIPLHSTKS